jgi:hypothetical protein
MHNRLIIFLSFLVVLTSCDNKSRPNNSQTIKVVSKENRRFISDTTNGKPLNDFDFTTTRINYSDSSFTDLGLICSDDTASACSLTFKIDKGFWFVKTDTDWQEFYNPNDSLLKVVYFKKQKFILKPIGEHLIYNNKDLHGFVKEDLYVYSSHENILYFHPDFGVVVIGRQASLIRSDFDEKTK